MRHNYAVLLLLIVANYAIAVDPNASTTESPVTTTHVPTTTLNPNTTAPLPTTTSAPVTTPLPTTTLAPTTTSAPATTAAPVPDVPKVYNFTVSEGNETCITAEFALTFTHLWNGTDNVVVVDPNFIKSASRCGNETETLSFSFTSKDNKNYSVLMTFKRVEEERSLSMIEVTEGSRTAKINQTAFQLKGDMAYHCEHQTEVKDESGATAAFDHVKLSIFRTETSGNQVYQCVSDDTVNDMVPIAVGCALLALVVIVLIAYFIGRRRSRRLAYQSV